MCFTISKFIQYKQKMDKQRVWFLAFYASLEVKMGLYVVWCMTISAVNSGLRSIFILWYFAWYFARKYQINIRYQSVISIKWLISRQPWVRAVYSQRRYFDVSCTRLNTALYAQSPLDWWFWSPCAIQYM